MTLAFPTPERGFAVFEQVQQLQPGVPIVLACRPGEMINLPRFLMHGLRFYVFRDGAGDYVFLVLATLESAIAVARAEEAPAWPSISVKRSRACVCCKRPSFHAACRRRPATPPPPATNPRK